MLGIRAVSARRHLALGARAVQGAASGAGMKWAKGVPLREAGSLVAASVKRSMAVGLYTHLPMAAMTATPA